MNYKFAFVLEGPNDYLRKVDLSYLEFLKPEELRFQYDASGVIYIEEDVNSPRADKTIALLLQNNIKSHHVNAVKWKDFPKLQKSC